MFKQLLEQLRGAGTGSKAIAGLVLVAVVGIAAFAAVVARRPHFELLYSELSASENAKVQKALSEAGIPFEQSQPPGPFNVYVDRSDRYRAMHAVAGAGALDRPAGGILPGDGGLSTVFMSSGEREQVTLKRQWQEMEHLLQELDFVARATVTTTGGTRTPFGSPEPRTGSVMLQLRQRETLTRQQANTVANLVRFGLGIEPKNLNVSDQTGTALFDGGDLDELGDPGDWLEQKRLFERDLEERANGVLTAVLGPNKARVSVSSKWNQDLSTTVTETTDPKARVVLSEETSSSKTPQGAPSAGGPAGAGTNSGAFGVDQAGLGETPRPAAGEAAKAETASKRYWAPTETRRTVSVAPRLERLSVSLFLDESLSERQESLAQNVKAAVGFDEERADVLSTVLLPLYVEPEGEGEGSAAPETGPNPMLEMLLQRGVEIASALVFLFLLAKALRGAKAPPVEEPAPKEAGDDMLELLAQAQIEELVKSDPARVGQILSSWAREEKVTAG